MLKERAALLADFSADSEAGDLAAKATAELNKALNALEAARKYAALVGQNASSIQAKLAQVHQEHQDSWDKYEKAKNYQTEAEKNAKIINTSAAKSDVVRAKNIRMAIKAIAETKESPLENTASSSNSSAQTAKQNANLKLAAGQSSVAGGQAKVREIETLIASLKTQAIEAAAELEAEEELFPDNPFPADTSLYFGKGFVKLVDGDGSPILFEIQADTSYKPVTDKGSYTDRIVAIEGGFQVIGKNGEIEEYSDTGKGYALLSKDIDTNGNQTTFSRTDEHLTAIVDAVGRRTEISYDADGHITGIVDPLGNTYAYEDGRLVTYRIVVARRPSISTMRIIAWSASIIRI